MSSKKIKTQFIKIRKTEHEQNKKFNREVEIIKENQTEITSEENNE